MFISFLLINDKVSRSRMTGLIVADVNLKFKVSKQSRSQILHEKIWKTVLCQFTSSASGLLFFKRRFGRICFVQSK